MFRRLCSSVSKSLLELISLFFFYFDKLEKINLFFNFFSLCSIGRTGRRDNKGVAYTFFTDEDEKQAYDLVKVLQQTKQDVHPQLLNMTQKHQNNQNNRFRQFGSWSKKRSNDHFDNNSNIKRVKRFDGNNQFNNRQQFSNSRY